MFIEVLVLIFLHSAAGWNNTHLVRSFPGFHGSDFDFIDFDDGSDSRTSKSLNSSDKNGGRNQYSTTNETMQYLSGSLMTIVIPSIYTLVFIISLPLNTAAILMFAFKVRPKKTAVIYMLNLAVADLLFVLVLPFRVSYHFNGNDWAYGPIWCRVVTSAFYCNMYCSILLMTCISADRFLAVVYPIKSLTWRSQRRSMHLCAIMWLLAVVGVMPILLSEQSARLHELGITTCHDVLDIEQLRGYYHYYFPIFTTVFFFIPLILTTICYVRIIQALRVKGVSMQAKRNRAVVMAVTVLTVFVVCFTPTNILLLAHYVQFAYQPSESSYAAYLVFMCIGSVNCCLDPVIYYFGSSQCRKKVAIFLRCKASRELQSSRYESSTTSTMETFQKSQDNQYEKLMV
ncbi:hypothetical protein AGOR_G00014140 [Albula goreensis]|uniref:Proteinase-activated receptor 1 n=1 Tax=Albula goreensis TaxID=1534307 RepID=A0A8T3EA02_9TELE|nr:hypothetical protein AGOR_G00014140 [Albula goreensis]